MQHALVLQTARNFTTRLAESWPEAAVVCAAQPRRWRIYKQYLNDLDRAHRAAALRSLYPAHRTVFMLRDLAATAWSLMKRHNLTDVRSAQCFAYEICVVNEAWARLRARCSTDARMCTER